jgi:hypothetical protein
MKKYRKKPIVIDAVRFDPSGSNRNTIARLPNVAAEPDGTLSIHTLEGVMTAYPGDWIIRGIKGEVYPCKADIFEATYESANPPENAPVHRAVKASEAPLSRLRCNWLLGWISSDQRVQCQVGDRFSCPSDQALIASPLLDCPPQGVDSSDLDIAPVATVLLVQVYRSPQNLFRLDESLQAG